MAITDSQIQALRSEAASAGDDKQVALCDAALNGDNAARKKCQRAVEEAGAADDAAPKDAAPKVLINVRFVVTDGPLKLRVFEEGNLLEERDLDPATAGDEAVEIMMDLMTKAGLAPEGT